MQEVGSRGAATLKEGAAVLTAQLPLVKAKAAQVAAWLADSLHDLLEGKVDWDKVSRQ